MLINIHEDNFEKESFPIIEGECYSCNSENTLILTNKKAISHKAHKIRFKCFKCNANFNYIIED